MLAVGRALMADSKPPADGRALDGPGAGAGGPDLRRYPRDQVQRRDTILLVEQNAYQALGVADRAYVLETGRIVLQGPAAELRNHREVRRAYLGG